ncbi:hypothetical protein [Roseomonas sp. KE2513]|uniref:hypothetical protein n=1 Tax=Roseomonas sp. KE2513 TaxID=2479202 RepID=UPI0018E04400|nr:hypothetical protein [Roseomonas sp. KE2513]
MLIRATAPLPRRRLREDSRLSGTILRMISSNSLAAFTQDVSRAAGIGDVRPVRATPARTTEGAAQAAPAQRQLEAVPPKPASPLPRGSLLDLRV